MSCCPAYFVIFTCVFHDYVCFVANNNAFNSLHRLDMLTSIRECLPELYAYCLSSYGEPSFLYFGPYVVPVSYTHLTLPTNREV